MSIRKRSGKRGGKSGPVHGGPHMPTKDIVL